MDNFSNTVNSKSIITFKADLKKEFAKRLAKVIAKSESIKDRADLAQKMYHCETDSKGNVKATTYYKSMIDKWCSPKASEFPSPEALYQLSKILKCDIDYLFCGIDYKTHDEKKLCELTGLNSYTIELLTNHLPMSDSSIYAEVIDSIVMNKSLNEAILKYLNESTDFEVNFVNKEGELEDGFSNNGYYDIYINNFPLTRNLIDNILFDSIKTQLNVLRKQLNERNNDDNTPEFFNNSIDTEIPFF